MMEKPILTVAVPIYNMEQWLEKNLATYWNPRLIGRLEVLCLNNASTDGSKIIVEKYAKKHPQVFTLIDRKSRGYGGAINEAIERANGVYFRIVDADDWVDTEGLIQEIDALENHDFDVILTDYEIVNMETGAEIPVRAGDFGIEYGVEYHDFDGPRRTLPSIHGTTYRTQMLRESGFQMQDNIFFVDEEYVILPYLNAQVVIYYPFDIYRYQVANPEQSTSPKNRGKYQEHRAKVLKKLIRVYKETVVSQPDAPALPYCFERIKRGVGDHFTTLYMYVEDHRQGRRLAKEWADYVKEQIPEILPLVKRKQFILSLLNFSNVSLRKYESLKHMVLRKR